MIQNDNETPEWEQEDEEIPPGLQKKWDQDERVGRSAGVCSSCGWAFSDEDLTCRHCGKPVEVQSGVMGSIYNWLFKTPWGVLTVIIVILSFLALIF